MGKNKKIISILLIIIALLSITTGSFLLFNNKDKESGNNEEPLPPAPDKDEYDGFTFSILKMETSSSNLVYSPLSIKYALSMLNEGASGKTKEELDNLLKELTITKYEKIDKVLSLANSVFIRNTYKDFVKNEYIDTLKSKYNAEVKYDPFESEINVNKWIEDNTLGIIKNMLKKETVVNPEVEMLLINALAIDMGWDIEFSNENTTKDIFTKNDKQTMEVAMMSMTTKNENVKYFKDDVYSVVSLPFKDYSGTQLEFIAVMPNNGNLDSTVTSNNLNQSMNSLMSKLKPVENAKLNIQLPRFDFEYETSLKQDLINLGVEKAFSSEADFTKISTRNLLVSDVLHKASIKATEKGVKAAAATVIIMKDNAAYIEEPEKIIQLKYDKPFLFIIRDMNTKEVWFVGTVYEPQSWSEVAESYQ